MKSKQRRQLREVFAQPIWKRHNYYYGMPYHVGRKHVKELADEEKAHKGQPLK